MSEIKNDLIDEETEEELEEIEEELEQEEETSEEAEEEARTIAEYQSKIDVLDDELASYHVERIDGMRFKALTKANYTKDQAARFAGLIEGNTVEEIAKNVELLKDDVPPPKSYVHQTMMGTGRKPIANNYKRSYQRGVEMARKLFKRGKIR